MKRIVTAIVTALEALAIVLAGFVIVAVPTFVVWLDANGLTGDVTTLFGTVVGLWFFGHGVPLTLTVDAASSAALGLAPETLSFALALLPLGFTLLTIGLSARIGWRLATLAPPVALWGVTAGGVTFFVLSLMLSAFAPRPPVSLGVFEAALLPTLLSALGIGAAFLTRSIRDDAEWFARVRHRILSRMSDRRIWLQDGAMLGLRLTGYVLLALTAVTSFVFAIALSTQYVEIVTLSQQLHVDAIGIVALFLVNLAYLPTFLIWTLSWIVGPGFGLGVGSLVSPIATELGPLPSIPILGILPSGSNPWALAIVTLVVVSGLLGTVGLLRQRVVGGFGRPKMLELSVAFLVHAVLLGLTLAFVMSLATGAIGPGRLEEVGPQPWLVAAFATLEVLIGAAVGAWLTFVDWDRVAELSKTSTHSVRSTLAGRVSSTFGSRFRRNDVPDSQAGASLASQEAGNTSREAGADAPPTANAEQETVEIGEFEPWWPDDEVR